MERLKAGLRKTGSSIATVFTGTQIDDALYEELEEALLMADTGVKATEHLLADLKRRVKESKTTDPAAVKAKEEKRAREQEKLEKKMLKEFQKNQPAAPADHVDEDPKA